MWVFLNNAFLSAVEYRPKGFEGRRSSALMVRARFRGDLERVFPGARVTETPDADYRFRCVVDRLALTEAMAREVDAIDYTNFKNSISKDEEWRHMTYLRVWSAMEREQERQTPKPRRFRDDDPWAYHHAAQPRLFDDAPRSVRGSKRKARGKKAWRGLGAEVETCGSCGTILQTAHEHEVGACAHCEDLPPF